MRIIAGTVLVVAGLIGITVGFTWTGGPSWGTFWTGAALRVLGSGQLFLARRRRDAPDSA